MFAIVNEDLFSYEVLKHESTEGDGKVYFRLHVKTSNKLVQGDNPRKKNQNRKEYRPKRNYYAENKQEELRPINREVIRLSAPLKDIAPAADPSQRNQDIPLTWNEIPMSIHATPGQNLFDAQLEVRCHRMSQDKDQANVYVIAFPFNGLINPIKEDPKYRIYKGFICSSAKPFIFNNRKYRKVMYLVIEIHKNLFNPDHVHHCDSIPIKLESYALFEDHIDGKKKTNHETMLLNITSDKGDYTLDWEYELIENAIYKNVEPGTQLWPTYIFGSDDNNPNFKMKYNPDKGKREYKGKRSFNQQKRNPSSKIKNPEQFQRPAPAGYTVTVNKHGIRKEVPRKGFKNYNHQEPYMDKDKDDSLDGMMKRSGMYDHNRDNNRHNNRGKKNGKNNKRR